MSGQEAASDHIPAARLLVIAESRETFFTNAEFFHVQVCRACFDLWKQYMEEIEGEKNHELN
jgi:hypothetical protein